jgi:hypothetical protein|nr:MAG TPA: hypothetical protein [Bacteriophage sp.]
MLQGIDTSSWQGDMDISNADIDFVIVKATEGTSYVNPACDNHYQQAKASGKKLGVYHYANGGDPRAEAKFFVDNIQGYIKEAILVLDWEGGSNGAFPSKDWAKTFLDEVTNLTGVRPLIYMSKSVIHQQDWSEVAKDYGLWMAQYANTAPTGKQSDPWTDNSGVAPFTLVMHQYTDNLVNIGLPRGVDGNIAYIDRSQWDKYANPTGEDKPQSTYVAPAPAVEQAQPASQNVHIVQAGDTLSGIASQYGTTYQELARINGIANPNLIYIGQSIKISGGVSGGGRVYTVKSGDTLSGIASQFGTSWQHLQALNGITNANMIFPGQQIRID